jgi:hypothetical protein
MAKSYDEMTDAERRSAAAYGEAAREKEAGKTPTEKAQERIKAYEKEIDKAEELVKYMEKMGKLGADSLGTHGERLKQKELELQREEELLKLKKDVTDEELQQLINANKKLEAEKKGYAAGENFWKRMAGIEAKPGGVGGLLTDPAGVGKGFGHLTKELLTFERIGASVLNKVVEGTLALADAQDKAVVSFRKSTGAAGDFDDNIRGLERQMVEFGVTSEEASRAVGALYNNVTDFTEMSEVEQQVLAANVALLGELGVSMDTASKNMQFFMKVQNQGAKQASESSRQLFKFAQDLGVSVDKVAADFEKAQGLIAALGDTGVQAFMDLESQAKATGLSMDSLLGQIQKFDRFDTAAESVGRLNAILGGPYLNTLEMVAETDPAERMRKLSEGVRASGVSFDEMSYYQKKAMTSAMGLNSEMELALFMSGKLETARGPVKTAADFEEMAEQTAQFNTVLEEMKQLGMMLAVSFGPLIGVFKNVLQSIQKFKPLFMGLAVVAAALAAALIAVAGAAAFAAIAASVGSAAIPITAGWVAAAATLGAVSAAGVMAYGAALPEGAGQLPEMANGGNSSGGLTKVGERGPELVNLPKGAEVISNGSAAFHNPDAGPMASAGAQGGVAQISLTGDNGGFLDYVSANMEIKPYVGGKKSASFDTIMDGVSKSIMGGAV